MILKFLKRAKKNDEPKKNPNFLDSDTMIVSWEEKMTMESKPRLVLNRIQTPDGTILTSRSVHDYVSYVDKNGLEYMVDGGLDYLRRNLHRDAPHKEMSVTSEAPFEQIRESFEWGTYGKKGDQPLKYVPISKMTDGHLIAIITQGIGALWVRNYMKEELSYRRKNDISISE